MMAALARRGARGPEPATAGDRYAVIGHPVAHSRSPAIHAAFAQACGQPMTYERLLAPLDGFENTLRTFAEAGGRGCNVTVPFKAAALAVCGRLSPRAQRAGAVNTLQRDGEGWFGDNTDGVGLVTDLHVNAGVRLAGRRVLLVGAGGAAAGALGPLIDARPSQLVVVNRTAERAQALVATHAESAARQGVPLSHGALAAPDGAFDVVINASASSLGGAALPLPATVFATGALALDMMYGPAAAAFLQWSASHGATPRDGLGMLVEQAAEAFALWRGVRPDTGPVLSALRAQVDGDAHAGASTGADA